MDEAFLRHGVTTVRDVGADLDRILELRRESRRGDSRRPRIFTCGPLIDGPAPRHGSVISVSVSTEEEAREMARRLIARGVDCLKVYEQLTPRLVQAIVQEARPAGIPVTAHLRDTPAVTALAAGVTALEHAFGFDACDEREAADVARVVVEKNAYVVPTLAITAEVNASRLPCLKRFVGRLQKLGGRVVAGTDTARTRPMAGTGLHRELDLLVEAGLSPLEALMAATATAAELLGAGKTLGTIETGKTADLVLLDADPVISIDAVRRIAHVVREGRVVWPR
jgi:imidazolonepropionase-like amidohydrolase